MLQIKIPAMEAWDENKEEFVNFISKYKTLADIKEEDRLCWTYP